MEGVTTKVKVVLLQVLSLQETNQEVKVMVQRELEGEKLELDGTTLEHKLQTRFCVLVWVSVGRLSHLDHALSHRIREMGV